MPPTREGPSEPAVFGGSSNGRTADSDSAYLGSNPSPPASSLNPLIFKGFFLFGAYHLGHFLGQSAEVKAYAPRVLSRPDRRGHLALASAFFVMPLTSDCDIESPMRVSAKQGQDHAIAECFPEIILEPVADLMVPLQNGT